MSYVSQSVDHPLFEDILWSKPETKALAGKLLIIGGNSYSIAVPSQIYSHICHYGAGEAKVVLPSTTRSYFAHTAPSPSIVFANSTPSGSFSHAALPVVLQYSHWAEYIVIAGDMTKNSETTTFTAEFLSESPLPVTIAGDSIDALQLYAETLLARPDTVLCVNFMQLQKFATLNRYHTALTSSLSNNRFASWLEEFSASIHTLLICTHAHTVYVASQGTVIATRPYTTTPTSMNHLVAAGSVWAMQHPTRRAEAIATAITQIKL